MIPAVFTRFAPRFGQSLRCLPSGDLSGRIAESAAEVAQDLYSHWLAGSLPHEDIFVSACEVVHDRRVSDTGLKTFDKQHASSGGFMTGNVTSNVQHSMFVRAHSNVECNDFTFPEGALREADLKTYRQYGGSLPGVYDVLSWFNRPILGAPRLAHSGIDWSAPQPDLRDTETILYRVFHWSGPNHEKVRQDHGWVLTDQSGKLLHRIDLRPGVKTSVAIMERAVAAFTYERTNSELLLEIKGGELLYVHPTVALLQQARSPSRDESGAMTEPRPMDRPRGA